MINKSLILLPIVIFITTIADAQVNQISFDDIPTYTQIDTIFSKNGRLKAIRYLKKDNSILENPYYGFIEYYNKYGQLMFIKKFGKNIDSSVIKYYTYYKNSNLKTISYQKGLKNVGIYENYYENTRLRYKIMFDFDGKLSEVISQFDENGIPHDKGTLKGGNGTFIVYDNDGYKKKVVHYHYGKKTKEINVKNTKNN